MPLIHRLPPGQASALRTAFGLEAGDPSGRLLVSVGVLSLIAEFADEAPVLCLVDDAHWLDRASATALAFVARRLQVERVALVLVMREGEEAFDTSGITELRLGGLDEAASRDVLSDRFPQVVTAVARRIVDHTMGNPLALLETASSLSDAELDGSTALPDQLPAKGRLTDGFVTGFRELPAPAQTFVLVVAADDTGSLPNLLDAAGQLGVPASVLDEVEASRLIESERGLVRFRHPLIRSAVMASSPTSDRRAAHKALAATYRALGETEQAAWHLAAATAGTDEAVAAELEEAATLARSRGGFEASCSALEHSAGLTPDREERARRLALAAEDAWTAGQIDRARELLDSSRTLSTEGSMRPSRVRLRAWIELTEGSVSAAHEILWDGSRQAFPSDPHISLEMAAAAAETAWVQSNMNVLLEIAQWVPSIEPTLPPSDRYHELLLTGLTSHATGDIKGAMAALGAAIHLAEELDDADLLNSAGHVAFYVGDDEAALRINSKVAGRSRVTGAIGRLLFALERQARAEILTGRWALAGATLQEASSIAQSTGRRAFQSLTSAWQALLATLRGTEESEILITKVRENLGTRSLGILGPLLEGVMYWAHAVYEGCQERPVSALQWLQRIEHPAIKVMAAFDRIEMALRSESQPEAEQAIRWAETLADAGVGWAASAAAYGRAMSSEGPAGPQLLAALESSSPEERPFDVARVQLALGAQLRRSRQRVEARRHLEAAMTSFEMMGAAPWSERAGHELRASGQTARARDPSAIFELTPQELQVARFVAEGLTNREVAARLFLSPRTVDYHLRKVFVKLGISSRSRLGQFLSD
jgi:DNA-binding CsgD family transcriptional regulator/tetratricopeptide (TPR) repeat protein